MNTESKATRKSAEARTLDDVSVADYLLTHPDFFERHTQLLMKLKVAHPAGDAVSLIERQVELLRNQNRSLERRLVDLVEVARSNDSVLERLHGLSVALLAAEGPAERVRVLEDSLRERFGADHIRLFLFAGEPQALGLDNLVRTQRGDMVKFKRFLDEDQAFCGRLRPAQLESLFAEQAARVRSAALIPIGHQAHYGMIALGSDRADHFNPTMGTVFLSRIGEITERALAPLFNEPCPAS